MTMYPKWAVFLIRKQMPQFRSTTYGDVTVTCDTCEMIATFDDYESCKNYVDEKFQDGEAYFLTSGYYIQ